MKQGRTIYFRQTSIYEHEVGKLFQQASKDTRSNKKRSYQSKHTILLRKTLTIKNEVLHLIFKFGHWLILITAEKCMSLVLLKASVSNSNNIVSTDKKEAVLVSRFRLQHQILYLSLRPKGTQTNLIIIGVAATSLIKLK